VASYTLTGKVATTTDANGHVTRYAYDVDDRLSQATDPVGNVTVYGYDALTERRAASAATASRIGRSRGDRHRF